MLAFVLNSMLALAPERPLTARRGFVTQTAGALAASAFVGVSPSSAGYVTSLGFSGSDGASADVDKEVLAKVSGDVSKVVEYGNKAKALLAKYEKDPKADISADLRGFNVADIRSSMNSVNTAFGEDFQKQSDRMVRNVVQDVAELEILSAVKDGATRSDKKAKSVDRFVVKLDKDLSEFISFIPK